MHRVDLRGFQIYKIEIFSGKFINSIKLFLTDGSVHGPFGNCNGVRKEIVYQPAENRGLLSYISGSAGKYLDKLRLHFIGLFGHVYFYFSTFYENS